MRQKLATLAAVLATLALSSCGGSSTSASTNEHDAPNTDPTKGWVKIEDQYDGDVRSSVWKRCDGTTLIYVSDGHNAGGITAVAGSDECKSLAR